VCARRKAARLGGHTEADHTFTVPYDILICSVGFLRAGASVNTTRLPRPRPPPRARRPGPCHRGWAQPQPGTRRHPPVTPFRPPGNPLPPAAQVGSVNATFGVPGAEEHCWFLKSMEDAQALRRHVRWEGVN
jgi:hypothetical protein